MSYSQFLNLKLNVQESEASEIVNSATLLGSLGERYRQTGCVFSTYSREKEQPILSALKLERKFYNVIAVDVVVFFVGGLALEVAIDCAFKQFLEKVIREIQVAWIDRGWYVLVSQVEMKD